MVNLPITKMPILTNKKNNILCRSLDFYRSKSPHISLCSTPTDWEEHTFVSLPHYWWPSMLVSPGAWHICVFTSSLNSLNAQKYARVVFVYVFTCLFLYIHRPKHWECTHIAGYNWLCGAKGFSSLGLGLHIKLLCSWHTDLMAMTWK